MSTYIPQINQVLQIIQLQYRTCTCYLKLEAQMMGNYWERWQMSQLISWRLCDSNLPARSLAKTIISAQLSMNDGSSMPATARQNAVKDFVK